MTSHNRAAQPRAAMARTRAVVAQFSASTLGKQVYVCYTDSNGLAKPARCANTRRHDRTTLEVAGMPTLPISLADNKYAIPVGQGYYAIVDAADLPLIADYDWHLKESKRGKRVTNRYASCWIEGKQTGMADLLLPHGSGLVVDHIDGDGLNNTRSNLRLATPQQNTWNSRRPCHSKSPYKGITREKSTGQWRAQIHDGKRVLILGWFESPEDAARAYDAKAVELRGEFAYLNFPDERRGK